MVALNTAVDVFVCLAAALGSAFFITNLESRFVSNLPDSWFKVSTEKILYFGAFFSFLAILWKGISQAGALFRWEEDPSSLSLLWSGYLGICLMTFAVYVVLGFVRHWSSPRVPAGVRVGAEDLDYQPPETAPPAPLPSINDLLKIRRQQIEIEVPGLEQAWENFSIGHLTDFHLGKVCTKDYIRFAVDSLMDLDPDVIAITGDFVDFPRYLDECFEALEPVAAPLGVFVVRGNHDYWVDPEGIRERIDHLGFTLLHERTVELERNGSTILLSGIESPWSRVGIPFDFIPEETDRLKIVLSHTPDEFPRLAERKPHLVISGHTHGGQVRLPFFGPLVVPSIYGRRFDRGFFKIGDSLLYVSCGIGCHPPLRTLCRPEVTVFRLHRPSP